MFLNLGHPAQPLAYARMLVAQPPEESAAILVCLILG